MIILALGATFGIEPCSTGSWFCWLGSRSTDRPKPKMSTPELPYVHCMPCLHCLGCEISLSASAVLRGESSLDLRFSHPSVVVIILGGMPGKFPAVILGERLAATDLMDS